MHQFNIPIISSNSEYKNVALNVVYFKDQSKNRHRMLFICIFSAFSMICEELLTFAQKRY